MFTSQTVSSPNGLIKTVRNDRYQIIAIFSRYKVGRTNSNTRQRAVSLVVIHKKGRVKGERTSHIWHWKSKSILNSFVEKICRISVAYVELTRTWSLHESNETIKKKKKKLFLFIFEKFFFYDTLQSMHSHLLPHRFSCSCQISW